MGVGEDVKTWHLPPQKHMGIYLPQSPIERRAKLELGMMQAGSEEIYYLKYKQCLSHKGLNQI